MARDDSDDEEAYNLGPDLRLRTVRTAASALAESIHLERRQTKRRKRFFFSKKSKDAVGRDNGQSEFKEKGTDTSVPGKRRNVYVNAALSVGDMNAKGEINERYKRNKVRTTKYTLLTFIPKNLYEQFRRVANLFFLTLVVLQLFPIFGAASGAIAALPLAFILTVTAIKDAVEDYRRATLDEQVNTSAVTRLGGGWRNVNMPKDPRSWIEKILGLNQPGSLTRGVKRLREREGKEGREVLKRQGDSGPGSVASFDLDEVRRGGGRLEDVHSMDGHTYPPSVAMSDTTLAPSTTSRNVSSGVVNHALRTSGSAVWERTLWKKLEVGDVVLLRDDEQVPADIVVLSTSDPDGMCYLETKNLDGETNLKPRRAVKGTASITSEDDVEKASFVLDSEAPHANLYLYNGVVRYQDSVTGERRIEAVSINELLLRGCMLRNTTWIVGLVVFTGADTKIMLNGGDTPSKRSKIEKETNFNVIVNFVVLVVMCVVAAVASGLEEGDGGTSRVFFEAGSEETDSLVLNAIITFVSCLIAFQNIVPISLYISIEIVKTIQAYFISQDVDLYYEGFDTPCVPKTWNISDDLGQIEYIFSDKTGTLTQNVMEFLKCSIGGKRYGEGVTEAMKGAALRQGGSAETPMDARDLKEKLDALKQQMIASMERCFKNRYLQEDRLTLVSPDMAGDLTVAGAQREALCEFFRALALCHSVLAEKKGGNVGGRVQIEYKAESPDEAALVAAARDVGFPFLRRGKDFLEIEVMGRTERWTPLRMIEFNSTRKRMSVIVRGEDGRVRIICKGADSVIYARLSGQPSAEQTALREQTAKDMEFFANSGLRTLAIASRMISEDEYLRWGREYDEAVGSVEGRDEAIDKACEAIERDLEVLGATALEDKLQEGVPEAIETLHQAGIKLWILTGDKLQTAIEIGYSCNLLKSDMDVMILSAGSSGEARVQIEGGLNKMASVLGTGRKRKEERGFFPGAQAAFAVVIDGDTLRYTLEDPAMKEMFLNLGTQCETVVCCRVSPAQKAETVKLVKDGRNAMTLSIGDGANDVAMIQEANIGCGLFGLEGSQAAMSADYAFGQFRFLTKLLIVHGRWSYQRVADMHSNFFYKNVIWTLGMFWYLPFNNFDATYLYQYTFILLYNLVFTSLPVIVLGAFDQDINARAALAFPQLYVRGIRGLEYTRTKFWLYMGDGLYQSAVVFFMPWAVWTLGTPASWTGRTVESISDLGTTVAVSAILAANTFVGMNTQYWTAMTWVVVFGSTIVMLLWIVVYSFFFSSDFIDEVQILFGGVQFWATVIFAATVALAPRFFAKFASTAYNPLDKEIVREMWVMGDLKDQLGIGHRKGKGRAGKTRDLEAAPMFNHARNGSDVSLHHGTPYEPAVQVQAPYDLNDPYVGGGALAVPTPGRGMNRATSPGVASYYSASDLPPPSPLPEVRYRYADGTTTNVPPSPSKRGSVSTQGQRKQDDAFEMDQMPQRGYREYSPQPYEQRGYSSQPHSPSSPSYQPYATTFQGHHPPPSSYQPAGALTPTSFHGFERSGSEASYMTAMEGDGRVDEFGHGQGQRESWQGGRAL